VPDSASSFFGQSSGYWTTKKDGDGMKQIWLMEDEDPNMISWLWRKMPHGLATLQRIFKLPLFLGETGTGLIDPIGRAVYETTWKVVNRSF
jgi:hypothetical protein